MAIKLTMKPTGEVTATAITERMSQAEIEFKAQYPTAETRYVPKDETGQKMIGVFVDDEFFAAATTRAAAYRKSLKGGQPEYCEACAAVHGTGSKCQSNTKWGKRSLETLNWFAKHGGGEWITGTQKLTRDLIEQNMSDLLCNFAHLCDIKGMSMGEVLRRAKGHYDAETSNQGQQPFEPQY